MGLRPRLLEARYPIASLSYVDREGRQTSHLGLAEGFGEVISLLRGDLARAVHDEVGAPVTYGTSVEAVEQAAEGASRSG